MKKITVKKMTLINFKGAINQEINFSDLNLISGDNATLKTTIADAWSWLFLGKNQEGLSDTNFDIKRRLNGTTIPKTTVTVEAIITVGVDSYVLRRELKEKWQKPRNAETEEFVGNETMFFIDGVPTKTKRDWEAFIASLIDPKIFALISNPLAFNRLDWKEQRRYLEGMVTLPEEAEVLSIMKEALIAKEQLESLKPNETIDSKRESINKEISVIKKHIESFDSKIEEVNLGISRLSTTDFSVIEKQITEKEMDIKALTTKLVNYAEAQESLFETIEAENKIKNDLVRRKYTLESEQSESLNKKKQEVREKIQVSRNQISQIDLKISQTENKISEGTAFLQGLREKFEAISKTAYTPGVCGACNRAFEETEQSRADFNDNKKRLLGEINTQGRSYKGQIESFKQSIINFQNEISLQKEVLVQANKELQEIEDIATNPEIAILEEQIEAQTKKLDSVKVEKNEADELLLSEKQAELKALITSLAGKTQIQAYEKRLTELYEELANNNKRLTVLQGQEYALRQYSIKYYSLIESRVNSLFTTCKFSFYKELNNGEIEQRCVCTENGVIYNSINNGQKVNIGLEIINVLSNHYEVSFPIFIDNAESVTKYLSTVAQLTLLIVDENAKKLQIINK